MICIRGTHRFFIQTCAKNAKCKFKFLAQLRCHCYYHNKSKTRCNYDSSLGAALANVPNLSFLKLFHCLPFLLLQNTVKSV